MPPPARPLTTTAPSLAASRSSCSPSRPPSGPGSRMLWSTTRPGAKVSATHSTGTRSNSPVHSAPRPSTSRHGLSREAANRLYVRARLRVAQHELLPLHAVVYPPTSAPPPPAPPPPGAPHHGRHLHDHRQPHRQVGRSPDRATAGSRPRPYASWTRVCGSTTRRTCRRLPPSPPITYIDGDAGILRYRGYPIEQLAEHSHLPRGGLPPAQRRAADEGAVRGVGLRGHPPHVPARERPQAVHGGLPL